ncbi:hypothetical protein JZ751_018589 [Albula glossodonta]|uniref:Methylated-DNA--protein-cysteine methyltransferase n=1 Tax=Albula glossodonta TaxID=121402 RepID=A0A8T2NNC3_9TELE|nr:hypothetical protein JZ751_018589 [Albula glossodonta]
MLVNKEITPSPPPTPTAIQSGKWIKCISITFTGRVLQTLLKEVKVGETVSYKRLAEMAGNSKAVRAVGGAMRRNPYITPWNITDH